MRGQATSLGSVPRPRSAPARSRSYRAPEKKYCPRDIVGPAETRDCLLFEKGVVFAAAYALFSHSGIVHTRRDDVDANLPLFCEYLRRVHQRRFRRGIGGASGEDSNRLHRRKQHDTSVVVPQRCGKIPSHQNRTCKIDAHGRQQIIHTCLLQSVLEPDLQPARPIRRARPVPAPPQ